MIKFLKHLNLQIWKYWLVYSSNGEQTETFLNWSMKSENQQRSQNQSGINLDLSTNT